VAGDVILRVGARQVRKASDVVSALQLYRPGARVSVTILRGGAERDIGIELPE
jgi:S1-C subfamily serine protease